MKLETRTLFIIGIITVVVIVTILCVIFLTKKQSDKAPKSTLETFNIEQENFTFSKSDDSNSLDDSNISDEASAIVIENTINDNDTQNSYFSMEDLSNIRLRNNHYNYFIVKNKHFALSTDKGFKQLKFGIYDKPVEEITRHDLPLVFFDLNNEELYINNQKIDSLPKMKRKISTISVKFLNKTKQVFIKFNTSYYKINNLQLPDTYYVLITSLTNCRVSNALK